MQHLKKKKSCFDNKQFSDHYFAMFQRETVALQFPAGAGTCDYAAFSVEKFCCSVDTDVKLLLMAFLFLLVPL